MRIPVRPDAFDSGKSVTKSVVKPDHGWNCVFKGMVIPWLTSEGLGFSGIHRCPFTFLCRHVSAASQLKSLERNSSVLRVPKYPNSDGRALSPFHVENQVLEHISSPRKFRIPQQLSIGRPLWRYLCWLSLVGRQASPRLRLGKGRNPGLQSLLA
jgi:hypothetical protein